MNINPDFKALIPPLTVEEFEQLEKNILNDGIREPISLWNDTIIDGHNRYEIAKKHGLTFTTISYEFESESDVVIWIITQQFGRRNISAYDRAVLALRLKPLISEKAKQNQVKAGVDKLPQKSSEAEPIETRIELGKAAHVSHDTIHKVEIIEKSVTPEVKEQIRRGDTSINKVYQEIKRKEREQSREVERIENAEKITALDNPLEAQGLFQTIVIDPPWDWGDEGDINQLGRAKPDYATMPIDDIEKMPISQISDENCHLYLWVTNRSLPKAFRLIEAWGFRYITCLTWVKPSFGMGNYFRGSTEQVLFAVKGSQPLRRKDAATHFMADRGKGHSAKPDEFYSLVESCSYAPYIDIFGRKERSGWTVWGENTDS